MVQSLFLFFLTIYSLDTIIPVFSTQLNRVLNLNAIKIHVITLNKPLIINDRAAILLKQLVASYIQDGQPVGSRQLAQDAGLTAQQENDLFDALQRKAVPEIEEMLADVADRGARARLASLATLNGDRGILETAYQQLAGASKPVMI